VTEEKPLNKIISFVELNYERMPKHLHQKVFLYRRIFEYVRDEGLSKNNERLKNFHALLQMKDF
jgi:hypothetical protein